jgi:hypothetical protein
MYWSEGGSSGRELIWSEMLVSSASPSEAGAMFSRWMHWCFAPRESQEVGAAAREDAGLEELLKLKFLVREQINFWAF